MRYRDRTGVTGMFRGCKIENMDRSLVVQEERERGWHGYSARGKYGGIVYRLCQGKCNVEEIGGRCN